MPVRGKGPWFRINAGSGEGRRLGNLSTPISVQKLQAALHAKAKAEPEFRFYALYDKLYRLDVLTHAYDRCRANKGAPGVDGQTFDDIERYGGNGGLGNWRWRSGRRRTNREAIKRVFIPKANGKLRPLGISSLRDRVCMMAAVLVLEPIFEADLARQQYAYRAGAARTMRWRQSRQGCAAASRKWWMPICPPTLIPFPITNSCCAWRVAWLTESVLGLVKSWLGLCR